VGRNWAADGYGRFFSFPAPPPALPPATITDPTGTVAGDVRDVCGATSVTGVVNGDLCLADQPYIAINGVLDPLAYITYTLIDFNLVQSNIYVQTAAVPAAAGSLPFWSSPATVDINANNPYCTTGSGIAFTGNLTGPACQNDWGAMPAVGPAPDGTVYIAYESADLSDPTNFSIPNSAAGTNNALLVASLQGTVNNTTTNFATAPVLATSFAAEVLDHDVFESLAATDPLFSTQNPAQLDPSSGAYFTIPNRPTIAVTGPVTIGGNSYPAGIVIVAWTDQRSLVLSSSGAINGVSTSRGTRIWYTLGAIKFGCSTVSGCVQTTAIHFDLLGRQHGGFGNTPGNGNTGFTSPLAISQPTNAGDVIGTGSGLLANNSSAAAYYMAEVHEPVSPTCSCASIINQFFPAIAAVQNPAAPVASGIPNNIFIGYYEESSAAPTTEGSGNAEDAGANVSGAAELVSTNATMFYNVAKSNDLGQTFGVNPVTTAMPLPTIPNDADYCAVQFGFTFGASGTSHNPDTGAEPAADTDGETGVEPAAEPANEVGAGAEAVDTPDAPVFTGVLAAQLAQSHCNNVPYFGTYTGAAPDSSGTVGIGANGAYFSWTSTLPNTRNFLVAGSQDVSAVHVN
jgi:hypothetical protein